MTSNQPGKVKVRAKPRADHTARWLALIATITSVASTVYFFRKDDILLYPDAYSHIEIARRVIQSPTVGPAQLGYVWLPLPHILMLPFVWNNTLYYDGLAGSVTSMVSYVVASVLIYKIVFHLTGEKKIPGLVGTFVFMANPNILYMQSTPMTELLLFATMLGAIYGIQRWIQTEKPMYLFGGGLASILATLARYEAWVLAGAMVLVVTYTCIWRHYSWAKMKAVVLINVFIGCAGILFWVGWNQYFFGNPLDFFDGQYAKPSNWVNSADPLLHHPMLALKTYLYAMVDDLHMLVIVLAVAGLVLMLIRYRLSATILPVLANLLFVPFFVYSIDTGQRPMAVTQVSGTLYSVRFGLIMVIPAAIFVGYLASLFERQVLAEVAVVTVLVVLVGSFGFTAFQNSDVNIVTLREPIVYAHEPLALEFQAAGDYLGAHYKGGMVLAQFFGNEGVLFDAKISPSVNIYEGSYKLWAPALKDPVKSDIEWIVMRSADKSDQVYTSLYGSDALHGFKLMYDHLDYFIYKRK